MIEACGVCLDETSGEVMVGEDVIELTKTQVGILDFLMQRPGWYIPKTEILKEVFGECNSGIHLVEVHVSNLRKRLEPLAPRAIRTAKIEQAGFGFFGLEESLPAGECVESDGLKFYVRARRIIVDGKETAVTWIESIILEYLLRRQGQWCLVADIAEHMREGQYRPSRNTIDTHIYNLRRKLSKARWRGEICSKYLYGYRIGGGLCFSAQPDAGEEEILRSRNIVMNLASRRVWSFGREAHLTPTQWRLLQYLMERPAEVVTKDALLEAVFGDDVYNIRSIEIALSRLRKAIERDSSHPELIRTHRGFGVYFADEPAEDIPIREADPGRLIKVGQAVLDDAGKQLTIAGEPVALTPTEYTALEHLMRNAGRVCSKDALMRSIAGNIDEYRSDNHMVEVYVGILRKKHLSLRSLIRTVWGRGYKFVK